LRVITVPTRQITSRDIRNEEQPEFTKIACLVLLTNEHFLVPEVENSSLSTTHNFYYHFTANDKNRLLKEEITKKDHIRKL